jgi:hypothetical protein
VTLAGECSTIQWLHDLTTLSISLSRPGLERHHMGNEWPLGESCHVGFGSRGDKSPLRIAECKNELTNQAAF